MTRFRTIELEWERSDGMYLIELRVTPGSPGMAYGPPENCHPPEPPEADVVAVSLLCDGGSVDITDMADAWPEDEWDAIYEAAFAAADEAEQDAIDEAADRRYQQRKDGD